MPTQWREKTSARLRGLRERLDAIQAQEDLGSAPVAPHARVALILWLCVIVVSIFVYYFVAWFHRP